MSASRKRRVRNYVVVGFIVVVVIAGVVAWLALRGGGTAAITYRTEAVQRMTLTSSVSGVGNMNLTNTASINPGISGTVSGLTVKVGDKVTKGELLFTVVNPQLDLNVTNAQNSYNSAVAAVQQAQLSVLQAEQSLQNLEQQKADQATSTTTTSTTLPPTTNTTHPPFTTTTVPPTTTLPSTTTTTVPPSSSTSSTSSSSTSSSTSASVAALGNEHPVAVLTAAAAPSAATSGQGGQTTPSSITTLDIEVAQQQVANAQLGVTNAQAQVQSASLALQQAKDTAAQRQVVASIDGTITAINVQDGDTLGSGGSAASAAASGGSGSSAPIVITNPDALEATVSLAETDVVSVQLGQQATLTFDALPNLTLTGKVTNIDTSGTVNQGVVSYNVDITPDTTDASVKAGMTVTANIITQVHSDVLAVPNAAVHTNTSGTYVQVLQNGQPADVTVQVGISNSSYTEITSGLSENQQVITQTINPNASTSTTLRGTGGGGLIPGGGGGFVPGGGGFIPGGGGTGRSSSGG